jgi:hypothetical protein
MLRRSSPGDFSGDTNSSASIPRPTRDVGSAPVKVQRPSQWSVGSDPVGVSWQAKSDPAMTPYRTSPGGEGVPTLGGSTQSHLRTEPVRRRRKRWPYVLLGFLVAAGAGGTIAWQQTQEGNDEPAMTHVEAPPPAPAPQQAAPAETPISAVVTTPTPPKPDETAPPPPVETPKTHPAASKESHAGKPAIARPAVAKTPKEAPKETPKETVKETPKEAPREPKAAPPGLNCDPSRYSHMSDYPAACPH